MSEAVTRSGREFYMRSGVRYLYCEILVDQDQKLANHHRTIVAKTAEGRVFIACLGMGTWCEANYTDYAAWFRLVRDNVTKIPHRHHIDLLKHFKWTFIHRLENGWYLLDANGKVDVEVGWHKEYTAAFNFALKMAMDEQCDKVLKTGYTDFPPVLLQRVVNQIRWHNQHNPTIPDPA